MTAVVERLSVVENQETSGLLRRIAQAVGGDDSDALQMVAATNARLKQLLRAERPAITVNAYGAVRVEGLAGLLHLAQGVELEIVPKFLSAADANWREDFFVLAVFSETGRLLPRDQIRASAASRRDLATLVGRAMVDMYWENHRRPLRSYRRVRFDEFSYDGDVDPVSLLLPTEDGFDQTGIRLERANDANSVISSAALALVPEVADNDTRTQLLRLHAALAPQARVKAGQRRSLPSRHQRWQLLYDLSSQVLAGFGLGFNAEHLLAPGYVMRTWSTWQSLCGALLRTGLVGVPVTEQTPFELGQRDGAPLMVTPDYTLGHVAAPQALADAKYGTKMGREATIDAADVYESLAFMEASGTDKLALLYPRPGSSGPPKPVGTTDVFQIVTVGSRTIVALEIECRGLSDRDGYHAMASRVAGAVTASALT